MRARRTHAPPSAYLFVDDAKRHGEPENYFLLWEESSNRNRCKLGHKPHKQFSVTRTVAGHELRSSGRRSATDCELHRTTPRIGRLGCVGTGRLGHAALLGTMQS